MALFQLQQSSKMKRCWSLLNLRIPGLIFFFFFSDFDQFRGKQYKSWYQYMRWKYLFNWQLQQFVKKMHVQIENALEKVLHSHLLQRPGRSDKETLIVGPTIL